MNKNYILVKLAKISKNLIEKSALIGLIFALAWQFAFPKLTSLAAYSPEEAANQTISGLINEFGKPLRTITVPVTAYNSLVGQTDDTPCLTANDFDLCKNNQQNVIAANFLPFGTKVRFPDYDPDTIYTVVDRMNARYTYRADIWMKTKSDALAFGIKNLKMEIYND
jgi:3D (Asp-Asp-Asp) domain-containing protein